MDLMHLVGNMLLAKKQGPEALANDPFMGMLSGMIKPRQQAPQPMPQQPMPQQQQARPSPFMMGQQQPQRPMGAPGGNWRQIMQQSRYPMGFGQ